MRDQMFDKNSDIVDFRFDEKVVAVFDDMVKRSVPGYESMIQMIGLLARTYGQDDSNYYDLGASTGATTLALALNNKNTSVHFIAIDNSAQMVEQCNKNLGDKIDNLAVICSDINDICIENASIVVLNLTLQFIDIDKRADLIAKIYAGLRPSGALIISEKIHVDDKNEQARLTELHMDFKRANGYSELEIANKRQSIENVLLTENCETHLKRLSECGFSKSVCYFQCLNFASFLSVK
ncbi:MAG: carboxy-S-adenosyl-L-methionine synthase CmoA [Gammaproteobacteria bacterium]|nr:carboxy-S-adenosyl-L-methionine synthase CmoA [Gammaproteobacteria bacterium]